MDPLFLFFWGSEGEIRVWTEAVELLGGHFEVEKNDIKLEALIT